jgi:hypothetical protein
VELYLEPSSTTAVAYTFAVVEGSSAVAED